MPVELNASQLNVFIDPNNLNFEEQPAGPGGIIGQARAAKAFEFGCSIKTKGFNIFACGAPGCGKTSYAREYAEKAAANEATPDDLCYVYNFKNPKAPKLLRLTPGTGAAFKQEMEELVNRLSIELPKTFGSKSVETKRNDLMKNLQQKKDELFREMSNEARKKNFGVKTSNTGMYFLPIIEGEMISEEQYEELSQDVKDEINKNSESVQAGAAEAMRAIKDFERSVKRDVEDFEYSTGLFEVSRLIGPLIEKYEDVPQLFDYLSEAKEDMIDNIAGFLFEPSEEEEAMNSLIPWYIKKNPEEYLSKYAVNVIADNAGLKGAPVVVEYNPSYANLVGEIEYDNEYGNFTTDFMKIKPGVLHKANGGYLIVQAHDLFASLQAWETLRRVLKTGEVVTEPLREYTTGLALSGVKPEPVPVDIKLIVTGSYFYYDVLSEFDDEFKKLFKVLADFDDEIDRSEHNTGALCGFVKKFAADNHTPPFDAGAAAKIVEYAARMAERQDKLTANFNKISEILAESANLAARETAEAASLNHVEQAIADRDYRSSLYEEKLSELIESGVIMIDTAGKKVGQINGLAVLETDGYMFAKPSRITATSYVGKAGIVNIEKEARLSGHLHDKGVQVLSGYLGQTYAQDFPLSLSCRICFEQNYSGVDGDSASLTELYAVLSSLSGLGINQEYAVTGSINQHGDVQPIGGVTYKIEGFFGLCAKRGLTGAQGVIIPGRNVRDLCLSKNVITAVEAGQFHIFTIDHADEGIELLTGVKAGKLNERGKYPPGSVHGLVYKKLKDFYKKSAVQ